MTNIEMHMKTNHLKILDLTKLTLTILKHGKLNIHVTKISFTVE